MSFDMVKFANTLLAGPTPRRPKDAMLPAVIVLPQSCAGCAHWNGDAHCALPLPGKLVHGFIHKPDAVVCVLWTKPDPEAA